MAASRGAGEETHSLTGQERVRVDAERQASGEHRGGDRPKGHRIDVRESTAIEMPWMFGIAQQSVEEHARPSRQIGSAGNASTTVLDEQRAEQTQVQGDAGCARCAGKPNGDHYQGIQSDRIGVSAAHSYTSLSRSSPRPRPENRHRRITSRSSRSISLRYWAAKRAN